MQTLENAYKIIAEARQHAYTSYGAISKNSTAQTNRNFSNSPESNNCYQNNMRNNRQYGYFYNQNQNKNERKKYNVHNDRNFNDTYH